MLLFIINSVVVTFKNLNGFKMNTYRTEEPHADEHTTFMQKKQLMGISCFFCKYSL